LTAAKLLRQLREKENVSATLQLPKATEIDSITFEVKKDNVAVFVKLGGIGREKFVMTRTALVQDLNRFSIDFLEFLFREDEYFRFVLQKFGWVRELREMRTCRDLIAVRGGVVEVLNVVMDWLEDRLLTAVTRL